LWGFFWGVGVVRKGCVSRVQLEERTGRLDEETFVILIAVKDFTFSRGRKAHRQTGKEVDRQTVRLPRPLL